MVDGKRVTIPSYLVKRGQAIAIDESFVANPELVAALEGRAPAGLPGWLKKEDRFSALIADLPSRMDVTHPINERHIVEFYSR